MEMKQKKKKTLSFKSYFLPNVFDGTRRLKVWGKLILRSIILRSAKIPDPSCHIILLYGNGRLVFSKALLGHIIGILLVPAVFFGTYIA